MNRTRILVAAAALFAATTALAQINPIWPYPGQTPPTGTDYLKLTPVPLDLPLASTAQPQYVNALPLPVDLEPDTTTFPGWHYYEIQMAETNKGTPIPAILPWANPNAGMEWLGLIDPVTLQKLYTPVWGYGQVNRNGGPLGGAVTYPAMNIRGYKNTPIKVKWINNAPDQHLFCPDPTNANVPCAIDRTLMGTLAVLDPANPTLLPPPPGVPNFVTGVGGPQQPDNAMVVHLHGGEIPPNSDGFAELWFGNANTAGIYSPGGAAQAINPKLSYAAGGNAQALSLVRPIGNAMLYNYPMVNQAATIWYHDHALGKTRINVVAGPAGFFPVNDPSTEDVIWGGVGTPERLGYAWATDVGTTPGCSTAGRLAGNCYEHYIVFQDRDFNAPTVGSNIAKINFPNGMNWAVPAPLVPQQQPLTPGGNATVHPQWVPEYFGTFPIVNGMAWPFMNVEPRKYRFHFLDGSNARCWSLKRSDGLPMTVIGNDQGYLPAPVPTLKLLMCPGERYDVVMDFTALLPGTLVTLVNDAPAPFPAGISPKPGDVKKPLQFKVVALKSVDRAVLPLAVATAVVPPVTKNRQMVLNEVLDALTLYPLRVQIDGTSFEGAITETPAKGATETWQIINTTGDAHPMHLHLVKMKIVSRQTFDLNGYSAATGFAVPGNTIFTKKDVTPFLKGKIRLPDPFEAGWKDTAVSYPGEVLTLVATWDGAWNTSAATAPEFCTTTPAGVDPVTGLPLYSQTCAQGDGLPTKPSSTVPVPQPAFLPVTSGPYVWHCHIVDHEDNEMMRPVVVQ